MLQEGNPIIDHKVYYSPLKNYYGEVWLKEQYEGVFTVTTHNTLMNDKGSPKEVVNTTKYYTNKDEATKEYHKAYDIIVNGKWD